MLNQKPLDDIKIENGYQVARYTKYLRHQIDPRLKEIPINRIQCKEFYLKHKLQFDKLYKVFTEKNINIIKYLRYFVLECRYFYDQDIDRFLLNINTINGFCEYLKINIHYEKVYKYFMKSANNIVDDCIKYGFGSVKDYILYLINSKKLVNEFVSGRISCYYLCSIQNFRLLVNKMDPISKQEFSKLVSRYDKYNSDVQEAFLKIKRQKILPIKFTDNLLHEKSSM